MHVRVALYLCVFLILFLSGKYAYSFAQGSRVSMTLPSSVRAALGDTTCNLPIHDHEQETVAKVINNSSSDMEVDAEKSPLDLSVPTTTTMSLNWFAPLDRDHVRNEESDLLSTLVYK